jgi:2-iminoacetate synthase
MFTDIYKKYSFAEGANHITEKTSTDVRDAISKVYSLEKPDISDYFALLSPAADAYLEDMASLSKELTFQRFGKTIQLFAPLYLSNECRSSCIYCGFSYENKIPRVTLSKEDLIKEAKEVLNRGFQHILILTGEDYSKTPVSYIADSIRILKEYFASVSVEIYPMDIDKYQTIVEAGADGLVLYQETYDPLAYKNYHLRGIKKDMIYRLEGPDRGGLAGFRRLGVGALLGLSDPYGEMFFLGLHIQHLYKNYWRSFIQASLPRLRPAQGDFHKVIPITDRQYVRFLLALRLSFPDIGLVLSTREPAKLRDHLIGLGVTSMSAGSKTEPGGYTGRQALEQFAIEDKRELDEVTAVIRRQGLDPVIKDFDKILIA